MQPNPCFTRQPDCSRRTTTSAVYGEGNMMEALAEAPCIRHHASCPAVLPDSKADCILILRIRAHNFPLGSFLAMEVLTHVRLRIGYQAFKRRDARRNRAHHSHGLGDPTDLGHCPSEFKFRPS